MPGRSKRCGQFSCTPGERVTMCSCMRVGPRAVVAMDPRAVATVDVAMVSAPWARGWRRREGEHRGRVWRWQGPSASEGGEPADETREHYGEDGGEPPHEHDAAGHEGESGARP